jgi:hypothetical protein
MAKGKRQPTKKGVRRAPAATSLLNPPTDTEVEAYGFIREQLKAIGWNTKNPSRYQDGQLWTQNQCFAHPEIKRCLDGMKPENVLRLSESKLWIIEAKRDRAQLRQAVKEAEEDYAGRFCESSAISVPLISGVAGNDHTGYEVRTKLLCDGKYQPVKINGREATGLLDPRTVQVLLETGNPDIADLVIDESIFLKAAEMINRTLHIGGINKNDRARVMAALLLALLEEPGPTLEADLPVLIGDINTRTMAVLKKHGKREFHPFVEIHEPTNDENHVKYKAALVRTIQELYNLSIKSAMNSGTDVLGKFYEVFLKYGNGAKEIGIVLTPRHFTRFAIEAVGVSPTDIVLDVACGTAGFLVAAFDHIRQTATVAQTDRFKKYNLFGIERESAVAALAIVNMIFRGDGKNNMVEANCFTKFLRTTTVNGHPSARYINAKPEAGEEPVTRVFMNPPFALKESDEKEWRFVETALASMSGGGLLLAIVPMSVMAEGGKEGTWRRDILLAHHTLMSVISLPEELFYPIANQTVALVVKKGSPHPATQPVLWGRVVNDGFRKSKGRRLPLPTTTPNDLDRLKPILRNFLHDPSQPVAAVPEFVCAAPVDFSDPILELVPEAYVDSRVPDAAGLAARLNTQVRENIASFVNVDLRFANGRKTIIDAAGRAQPTVADSRAYQPRLPSFRPFALDSLFTLYPGDYHSLADVDRGSALVVTCADSGNGISETYSIPDDVMYRDALTIAFNGWPLTTKMHPYEFGAKDDVAVAIPKITLSSEALVFIQATLNSERWRFSYYRKCFSAKLGRLLIKLPVRHGGELDTAFMESAVHAQPYWWFLAPRLEDWSPRASKAALEAVTESGNGKSGQTES